MLKSGQIHGFPYSLDFYHLYHSLYDARPLRVRVLRVDYVLSHSKRFYTNEDDVLFSKRSQTL